MLTSRKDFMLFSGTVSAGMTDLQEMGLLVPNTEKSSEFMDLMC